MVCNSLDDDKASDVVDATDEVVTAVPVNDVEFAVLVVVGWIVVVVGTAVLVVVA